MSHARAIAVPDAADEFAAAIRLAGLPDPEREFRFSDARRWRFDLAWPAIRLAVEVEGGGWVRGRHHRPRGYAADAEKYNAALRLGWRVYRYTPAAVRSGEALAELAEVLAAASRP